VCGGPSPPTSSEPMDPPWGAPMLYGSATVGGPMLPSRWRRTLQGGGDHHATECAPPPIDPPREGGAPMDPPRAALSRSHGGCGSKGGRKRGGSGGRRKREQARLAGECSSLPALRPTLVPWSRAEEQARDCEWGRSERGEGWRGWASR
jgi:hypothetical protein